MTRVTVLLLALLGVAACGGDDDDDAGHGNVAGVQDEPQEQAVVLRILGERGAEEMTTWPLRVMREGLRPLKMGRAAIRDGEELRSMPEEAGLRRIESAQVVLMADDHGAYLAQTACARLLELLRDRQADRPLGLVLEALPAKCQAEVDRVLAGARNERLEGLMNMLKREWNFPIEAYRGLLEVALRGRVAILAGNENSNKAPIAIAEPDHLRRPSLTPAAPSGEFVIDAFVESNRLAANAASTWLRSHAQRKPLVVVFFGGAHLEGGEDNIGPRLRRAGLNVVTLVPYLAPWEFELRQRFGSAAQDAWYEILPNLLRPSLIKDKDIVADHRAKEAQDLTTGG